MPPRPPHRIYVEAGRFVDRTTGAVFVPRGVNYFKIVPPGEDRFFSPAVYDRTQIANDFARLAGAGYNTVRIFLDSCSSGSDCVGDPSGSGLNPRYLDVIVEVMGLAAEHGLVLLLTSNDLPDQGGYYREIDAAADDRFPGYRNSAFLTAEGHDALVRYWTDLMTGLDERGARFDAILGWSILNEQWLFTDQPPLALTAGEVDTAAGTFDIAEDRRQMVVENIRLMIDRVAATIRTVDPGALVTMGFFAPQFPNETAIGGDWYVDTAPLVVDSDLDFFDFHAYPGEDIGLAEIAENFGIDDRKPVVMGEVGAFVHRYPTAEAGGLAVQRWIAESCDLGYDGWLYWGYLRAPLSDATWALTDAGGYLFDLLAPIDRPDPCAFDDPNLALGASVSASGSLAGEPPENAVDGNPGTQWGSGDFPTQWIEIDLDREATIGGVRLVVGQFPAGRTVHRIEVAGTDRSFSTLAVLEGTTAESDVLEVLESASGVRYVRITTTESPSWVAWKEVEILSP